MGERDRILSIDVLRGLDVLLMLFVNEVAAVRGAPAFLLHAPANADGMTLTDVVFPAFLFITGLSIPFALGRRLEDGQTRGEVWRHVLARSAALLAIGVLMVNVEEGGSGGFLPLHWWNVLATVGVALVWLAPGGRAGERQRRRLRLAGALLLLGLVAIYRAEGGSGLIQLRPHWWGILGLIGWAYAVAASAWLAAGNRLSIHVGLVAILYCIYFADEAGQVAALAAMRPIVHVGRALGSHGALTLSGTLLGVMLVRQRRREGAPAGGFAWPALGLAAALAIGGLLLHSLHALHPAFWINKVRATAPWCLLSAALTAVAWTLLYVLIDVRGWRRWPSLVTTAGQNALVAYLLAPFFLSFIAASSAPWGGMDPYGALTAHTWAGMIRSALFAWFIVWATGVMRRLGIRLQL